MVQTKTGNGAQHCVPPPWRGDAQQPEHFWTLVWFEGQFSHEKSFYYRKSTDNYEANVGGQALCLLRNTRLLQRHSSTEQWPQRDHQWHPAETRAEHARALSQRLHLLHFHSISCSETLLPFSSLNSAIKMDQKSRSIFIHTTNEASLSKVPAGSQSQLLQGPGWGSAWGQLHKTKILAFLCWT